MENKWSEPYDYPNILPRESTEATEQGEDI